MIGRSFARIATVAVLALVVSATSAEAQRVPERRGFWIGFGLGAGAAYGDAFLDDGKLGGMGYLRLGGSPDQNLLIGGDLIGWSTEEGNITVSRGAVMGTFMWYPSTTGGFFTKVGAGFSGRQIKFEETIQQGGQTITVSVEDETGGVAFGIGLGYDIQLGRNFFLVPVVDWVYTGTERDAASLFLLSIGVMWH